MTGDQHAGSECWISKSRCRWKNAHRLASSAWKGGWGRWLTLSPKGNSRSKTLRKLVLFNIGSSLSKGCFWLVMIDSDIAGLSLPVLYPAIPFLTFTSQPFVKLLGQWLSGRERALLAEGTRFNPCYLQLEGWCERLLPVWEVLMDQKSDSVKCSFMNMVLPFYLHNGPVIL